MFKGSKTACALLASAAMWPAVALAQAQPASPAPTGGNPAADAAPVGEIVVTAQKRNETLVNVPIAIVAVSGDSLAREGVNSVSALAQVVPGLHIDQAGAFVQPSIRGVSTAVAGIGAADNVATYTDGVYRPNALSGNFDFIDVDSIQVLKGPQGTLFGRNSTGGAILITTKTPSFVPHMQVDVGYGSFGTFTGSAYLTGPINDKLAASFAIGGEHSDGFRTNILTGQKADPVNDVSGRLKFLYVPTGRVKLTLILDAFHEDDPNQYAVSSYKGQSNAALFGTPTLSVGKRDQIAVSGPIAHVADGYGAELKAEVDLGFANLTSYTSGHWDTGHEYTNEMAAAFPTNGSLPHTPFLQSAVDYAHWNYHEETYSQEVDLGSKGKGPLDWTTGVFAYYDATTYENFTLGLYGPFGPGGVLTGGTPNPATFLFPAAAYVNTGDLDLFTGTGISGSIAVFGDATYNLGRWHLTLGGRYAYDNFSVRYDSFPNVADSFTSGRFTNYHNFFAFTPRAVLRYDLTAHSNVYVSYSEGTKSGLFAVSGYLGEQTPVYQERIRDVEAGYKIQGSGWHFEASGFHYDYSNLQVATYIGGASFLQNAPSAEIYGLDANWQGRLWEGLTLNIGGAWTHARYTDFPSAAYQYFDPVLGVVNSTRNVSGGVLQRAPEFTGDISLTYTHPLHGGVLSLNATGSYQTVTSFDFADTLKDGSHGLVNLRADWTDPSKRWTLSLIGQNVTDTVYLTQVLVNAGGLGATYGRPASYMAQVQYKF